MSWFGLRTGLIFCNSREVGEPGALWAWPGSYIIQYHFMSLPGQGKGLSFSSFWEGVFLSGHAENMVVECLPAIVFHCPKHFARMSPFLCTFFAIGIVVVHFLPSWMIPINGS